MATAKQIKIFIKFILGGLQIYDPYGWAVVASIARKNPYLVETINHTDIIDLKALKQDMKIVNVKKNEDGEKVKWNNKGSISWLRFEKSSPDVIKYKVDYNEESSFKKIKVARKLRQNVTIKAGYTLPKAFKSRVPVSRAKFNDLMELCNDLTIPSAHHHFYNNLPVRGQEESEKDMDSSSDSENENDEE